MYHATYVINNDTTGQHGNVLGSSRMPLCKGAAALVGQTKHAKRGTRPH